MDIDKIQHKSPKKEHESPRKSSFNFPFEPYGIQLDLMKVAYKTYEEEKFALLESPTGTGKSLSLICSSFTWLRDHQNKVRKKLEDRRDTLLAKIDKLKEEEEISGDWLSVQTKIQDFNREISTVNSKLDKIIKIEGRNEARRHAKLHNRPLEEYEAFNEGRSKADPADQSVDGMEVSMTEITASQGSQVGQDDDEIEKKLKDQEEYFVRPKVYYASRTHSQLGQFINEIKRTTFADTNVGTPIKVTPLGSRANYCINPEVTKLKDPSAINERCLELQRETNLEKRCPFIKSKQVNLLKEEILTTVQDIEDIVSRGKTLGSCPYYAARMSVAETEVVVLPYNNLLHHETRKASSLDLTESIVILDEAHNILETICSIHSAPITGQQLIGSHTILSRYYKRFLNRMAPRNAEMVRNVIQCLTALTNYLNEPKKHLSEYEDPSPMLIDSPAPNKSCNSSNSTNTDNKKPSKTPMKHEELMVDVGKFIGAAKIERFNIFKIIDYFNRSQLARKLLGFSKQDTTLDLSIETSNLIRETGKPDEGSPERKKRRIAPSSQPTSMKVSSSQPVMDSRRISQLKLEHTNLEFLMGTNPVLRNGELTMTSYPIYTLVEFLKSLTNLSHDGKVLTHVYDGNIRQSILKFILLNPSSQFKQMVSEARSIVLAGGTMQPFSEFIELLFGPLGIERDRLALFSCGHVISKNQLYLATLSQSFNSKPIELSFKTRSSMAYIDEIGLTVQEIASLSPAGMVCFFPSYDYEQLCYNRWNHVGVISKIETKYKQVFREPRQANHVKLILDEYSNAIEKNKDTGRGAILFSVVGGKMSEGINFNDDLGRCIVMIGLPYPNIKSGELQQKMSYYDKTCKNQPNAGQLYYENLCIKGINQSIGRAVRHKNDYSAIILLDRRYSSKNQIRNGLPSWMRNSLVDHEKFVSMFGQLKAFYNHVENFYNSN